MPWSCGYIFLVCCEIGERPITRIHTDFLAPFQVTFQSVLLARNGTDLCICYFRNCQSPLSSKSPNAVYLRSPGFELTGMVEDTVQSKQLCPLPGVHVHMQRRKLCTMHCYVSCQPYTFRRWSENTTTVGTWASWGINRDLLEEQDRYILNTS
jgi:hypothetical protein